MVDTYPFCNRELQIYKKLDSCYDQIVHPQKSRSLRILLDSVMGRIVELKHEMSDLEKTEFKPFDDILQDLKITPDDVAISVPRYYTHGRSESYTVRQKVLHQMIEQMDSESKKSGSEKPKMNLDEATKILQMHERARQGRLRAKFMWELSMEEERKRKISKGLFFGQI